MMNHIDLCSGIGGFALGFQWAGLSKPVLFCDIEPWSRKILKKHWPDVPIAEDVKELASEPDGLIPRTDPKKTILTAGYPCQPFSHAGKRLGHKDDRHIWPYILQIVAHKRPAFCVFENVYGHVSMGLDQVLLDLEAQGYATRPFIVPACGVDAPHRRDRIWIIAHTDSHREPNVGNASSCGQRGDNGRWAGQEPENRCEDVADTRHAGVHQPRQSGDVEQEGGNERRVRRDGLSKKQSVQRQDVGHTNRKRGQAPQQWLPEPSVGRVAHGIPKRVDRLRGLGNAIVPQIAMKIGEAIRQHQHQHQEPESNDT